MAEDFDFDVRWLGSPWGYWDNREEAEKSEITQIESATDQLSDLQISAMGDARKTIGIIFVFVQCSKAVNKGGEKIQESKLYGRKSSEDLKELSHK